MLSNEKLEQLEYDYLKIIKFHLIQDLNHIINGLNSRLLIFNDWYNQFIKTARSDYKASDLETGAERIFHHFFATIFKFPNSSPVGSDLMYIVPEAVLHIDIKTALISNTSDFKGKINVAANQSSYNVDNSFHPNLPTYYTVNKKKLPCLTYIIQIIHEHAKPDIKALILASVPNGQLYPVYGNSIVQSGKAGVGKSKDFRFKYSTEPVFKLLSVNGKIFRVELIYLSKKLSTESITNNKDIPVYSQF